MTSKEAEAARPPAPRVADTEERIRQGSTSARPPAPYGAEDAGPPAAAADRVPDSATVGDEGGGRPE